MLETKFDVHTKQLAKLRFLIYFNLYIPKQQVGAYRTKG
jgi:hypothetical protein